MAFADKYRFGPYEVRTRTRELFKYGTRLKLRPQPFQVLQMLLDRPGEVVTRGELRQMLWPGETYVDFEHGLNTSVKELRRVLSDSASDPQYVETLPKLGYRIKVPVEAESMPPVAADKPPEESNPSPQVAEGSTVTPPVRRWSVAASAVTLVAIIAGWWLLGSRPAEPETSVPVPLTSFPGMEQGANWSPDGRQVAFAWNGEQQIHFDLYIMQPGSSHTLRLTSEPNDNINPAWSPDGRWIAYVNRETTGTLRSSLNLISPLGGPKRTVLASETAMGRVSWLPDGRSLVLEMIPAIHQPAQLWIVWPDTGRRRALTFPPPGIPGDTAPTVSPDGRTVAFCRATFWRTAELYTLDLKQDLSAAGAERRLTDLGFVGWPAWTPDGRHLVFDAHREGVGMWEIDRNGHNLRPIIGLPPLAWQPAIASRPGDYNSLAFTNGVGQIKIWRFNTIDPHEAPMELAVSSRSQSCPRYSSDGKRLAYNSDRTGQQEIWVANADGSEESQLTNLGHPLTEAPDWSPSDDQIAFVTQDRANREIYTVSASGGPPKPITDEQGILSGGGWSSDGGRYYYTSTRSGRAEVWEAPRNGGRPQQVTWGGGLCGFESRHGVFYYWKGELGSTATLIRRTAAGDRPLSSVPAGISCRVAGSRRGFYFVSAESGGVLLYDETTESVETVVSHPGHEVGWFSVSPDGHWLAMSVAKEPGSDLMMMEHFR